MTHFRLLSACASISLVLVLAAGGEAGAQSAGSARPAFQTSVTFPRTFTGRFDGCEYHGCAYLRDIKGAVDACRQPKNLSAAWCRYAQGENGASVSGTLMGHDSSTNASCSMRANLGNTSIFLWLYKDHTASVEIDINGIKGTCEALGQFTSGGTTPATRTLTWEQGSTNAWQVSNLAAGGTGEIDVRLWGSHVCTRCL